MTAAEEERTWADTAEEEAKVKLEVAEQLWDTLVTELATELLGIERCLADRRQHTAGGASRLSSSGGLGESGELQAGRLRPPRRRMAT
eukprot:353698-Chlamydomonas_euryale.AAC.1